MAVPVDAKLFFPPFAVLGADPQSIIVSLSSTNCFFLPLAAVAFGAVLLVTVFDVSDLAGWMSYVSEATHSPLLVLCVKVPSVA